ncbi:nitrate regulatory protein NasR [Klebsiella pneumoniae]|uniref:nitrate regulatory protein NasR n=1 Tax=Klebsiella pneumoniae TaxID=573 RepID=UPI003B599CAB
MNNTTGHAHDATAWLQLARRLQKQQLQQLSQLGELASQLSALVHMLQCERGASNIYLCSGGLLYTAECRAGGALVDELAQLPALRAQIGRRQIAAEAATEQFSRVIRHLLNIAPQLNDSIDDPPVAGRMVALYSFMQGKELVGQERALGALGFTRGEFSDSLRQQLVDRIDGQQPCFDSFQALGSPATVQLFRTQCHAGLDIEQLRRIACTRQPAADGGETALRWFGLQTQRLEQLREVEEQLIDDLLDATDALLADDAPGWQAGEEDDSVTPRLDKQLLPLVRQQAYELQQLSSQLASLKDALEERKLIEKAKSLLMTHQGMQEEQAWQTLRKMAMDKNQRMVEIARALLMVKAIWPLTPKE